MDILGLKYKQFSGGGVKKYFFQTRKKHEFFIFELCMIQKWIKVMDSILIFCRLPKYSELRCAQTFCFFYAFPYLRNPCQYIDSPARES